MKPNYYFQYNLPADNHKHGNTDHYIDVKAEKMLFSDIVYSTPIVEKVDLRVVINWDRVLIDIEEIGRKHFEEVIKQEKIDAARKVLSVYENPITERMETKETLEPTY